MLARAHGSTAWADDRAALRAACEPGVGLCTIVGIEGSFSRRLGAQLAVHPDGAITGSLADGCLERQLASEVAEASGPVIKRFGSGSELIDFRLPCGSGLDVLIDPEPDRDACQAVVRQLDVREVAALRLPCGQLSQTGSTPARRRGWHCRRRSFPSGAMSRRGSGSCSVKGPSWRRLWRWPERPGST